MKQALVPLRVAALAVLLLPLHAPSPAGAQRSPHAEGLTAVAVEIPVQVVDSRGAPVRGLTANDFEVYEGRRRRAITDFQAVDLEALRLDLGAGDSAPLLARRHFVLLFDLSHSEPAKLTRARHAARELVSERLLPSDLVAVATYGFSSGARWVLGFTSDRRQIAAAIGDLGLRNTEWTLDPLGIMRVGGPGTPGGIGGVPDSVFQERVGDLSVLAERAARGENRGHATAMMQGYRALAERLRWVPGRKHVILLSQGMSSDLLVGTASPQRMRAMDEAAAEGRLWAVDSEERFGSAAMLDRLERLLETLRRADATVHAVDITGILADPLDIAARPRGEDSLFLLADGTGGELYRNFNDLGAAMGQLLERTSVTYLLTIQPDDLALDGAFHPIRVRLAGGQGRVRVVHRPGYYAPLPFGEQSAEARQLAAAEMVLGGEVGGPIPVSALAVPLPGTGELAPVPLLVEIDGPALVAGQSRAPSILVDLYAYAFDRDREVRDFASQQMGLDLKSLGPALLERGVKYVGQLDLPPGDYTIRVLVRELASGRATIQETSVVVPRLAAGQPALLPPLFPDAKPEWLTVREGQAPGGAGATPARFVVDGREFVPAARPVVVPGAEADMVLMTYHAAAEGRRLEGRILDAAGAVVAPARLERLRTLDGGAPGVELVAVRFHAFGLRAGPYTLEVSLVDPATGDALTSSIPLLVGPLTRRDEEPQPIASLPGRARGSIGGR